MVKKLARIIAESERLPYTQVVQEIKRQLATTLMKSLADGIIDTLEKRDLEEAGYPYY